MNALGFDSQLGLVRIAGCAELFAPRSLVATLQGGMITVTRVATGEALIYAPYTTFAGLDGATFGDADGCLAYLAAALTRRPVGDPVETPVAALDLGGLRLVRPLGDGSVVYASSDDPDGAVATLGLTLAAATASSPIDVLTRGPVEDPSWAFTPGPVFLGLAGAMTGTPPTAGLRLPLGRFVTPTRLVLALGPSIVLAS